MKRWGRKHLLGLEGMSAEEINFILDEAVSFREISERPLKKVPTLRGKSVVMLFFEPSTRTRASFELAAKRLSADTVSIASSSSSVVKGETLLDTARNLEAMKVDIIVMRHSMPGAPHMLARHLRAAVINAGDGAHEHPTQGLLDLLTIRDHFGSFDGLCVGIVGDIAHSRVARSNILGLTSLGAEVIVCGPPTLIPRDIDRMGVQVTTHLDELLPRVDALNILRIQLERQGRSLFPSLREYSRIWGVNNAVLDKADKKLLIMHPGPVNRGVELAPEVADGEHSVILDQVTNGVAVRMALLYHLSGVAEMERADEAAA